MYVIVVEESDGHDGSWNVDSIIGPFDTEAEAEEVSKTVVCDYCSVRKVITKEEYER